MGTQGRGDVATWDAARTFRQDGLDAQRTQSGSRPENKLGKLMARERRRVRLEQLLDLRQIWL